jgi:hypothetical protein
MTDLSLWTGLVNVGAAAVTSLAIAFFDARKNVRAALVLLVCITALVNFHFQRTSTISLASQISELQINRWEPLTEDEGRKFALSLTKSVRPSKRLQIVCGFAGCSDLALSIRAWAGKADWEIAVVPPMFGSAPQLEFWYYDDVELGLLEALENATQFRLKATRQRFENANSDQINLFIGSKS